MNPELQKELAAWLTKLREGSDFLLQQAPEVVREKVLLGRAVETSLEIGLAAAVVCCAVVCLKSARRSSEDDIFEPVAIVAGVVAVMSAFGVVANFERFLQVWFAPRLYIIDWLSSLVK